MNFLKIYNHEIFKILFFILILISCQKENNNSGIRYDLYKGIIKYKKEKPIDRKMV